MCWFSGVLEVSSAFTLAWGGVVASRLLHERLLTSILSATMAFLARMPKGRLLNRFSGDMAEVDFVMPFTVRSMINTIVGGAMTLAVVASATPLVLLLLPPLAVVYFYIQVLF